MPYKKLNNYKLHVSMLVSFMLSMNSPRANICNFITILSFLYSSFKIGFSLSIAIVIHYMSPLAGDIYRSWFRVCPSVRP